MRIISGSKKGMELSSPHGHKTHPMSEKLRGAIFNALGDVEGLTILDPFCGTAAVALEGLSRGAVSAVCIDADKHAQDSANQNIVRAGFGNKCKLIKMNASVWSDQNQDDKYDLIFLDPSFNEIKPDLLTKLATNHSSKGSVIICNLPTGNESNLSENFELLQSNSHGDATLWFYRRLS